MFILNMKRKRKNDLKGSQHGFFFYLKIPLGSFIMLIKGFPQKESHIFTKIVIFNHQSDHLFEMICFKGDSPIRIASKWPYMVG